MPHALCENCSCLVYVNIILFIYNLSLIQMP